MSTSLSHGQPVCHQGPGHRRRRQLQQRAARVARGARHHGAAARCEWQGGRSQPTCIDQRQGVVWPLQRSRFASAQPIRPLVRCTKRSERTAEGLHTYSDGRLLHTRSRLRKERVDLSFGPLKLRLDRLYPRRAVKLGSLPALIGRLEQRPQCTHFALKLLECGRHRVCTLSRQLGKPCLHDTGKAWHTKANVRTCANGHLEWGGPGSWHRRAASARS